jgi:GTP 3',8-cyclase
MRALIDSFGRQHTYLRISVTERCNLRCIYCMPHEGIALRPRYELLTFDEIERVSRVFTEMGVTKIRLTGGEPLMRKELPEITQLAITTNGVLLKNHLPALKESGLTHVNISLDTLQAERFNRIALRSHFADVIDSIEAALAVGFSPLTLNVVVMGGINDDELLDFVAFARTRPVRLRFIEYMPFKFNAWNKASLVPFAEMKRRIEQQHMLVPAVAETEAAVAREFQIPGWQGTVGFITSMSDHFCNGCNRIRLTADGSIKPCLFHPAEVNLRAALRSGISDSAIAETIRAAVLGKPAGHAHMDQLVLADNRTMIEIGG